MFTLPTFFSFPWSFPLPSLPSISLPAYIQRRFLSHVLKRSLGRFVKAGGLDVERIQAQIGEGWVEIEGLEVDTDEINSLVPPTVPLRLTSGTLSKVTARIPFPNLWSDPLSITLDTLQLDLALHTPTAKGKSPDSPRSRLPHSPSLDLASSVTTAADEFLHEELDAYEEAELDRSIRQSLVLHQLDPFSGDDVPGAFPSASSEDGDQPLSPGVESTTVLAGLVERVLARLEFKVKNVNVRITHDDPRHGGVFELRLGEVRYADESGGSASAERDKTIRAIRLSGVAVYMLPLTPSRGSHQQFLTSTSRSASTSSTLSSMSTDSSQENNEMMMSLAVADLRQSMATSIDSGASVYRSALSEAPGEEVVEEPSTPIDTHTKRKRSSTATGAPKEDEEVLLLSFGTDDVVLRTTTIRPTLPPVAGPIPSSGTSPQRSAITSFAQMPSIQIDLTVGTLVSLILPSQSATILSVLQAVVHTTPTNQTRPPTDPSAILQPQLEARLSVKAIYVAMVYDLSATNLSLSSVASPFWTRPASTDIHVGHLKLRLEDLQVVYASKGYIPKSGATQRSLSGSSHPTPRRVSNARTGPGPSPPVFSLTLGDASLFEYLATAPSTEDSPPGGSFPVLIFDSNLLKQYDSTTSTSFLTSKHTAVPPSPVFPEFDAVDWRNSGLQRRGGAGEKVWKVRQKGRGVLKGSAAVENDDRPVVTARTELSDDAAAAVNTLPIHIFLDLSLVERLLPVLRHISPALKSSHAVTASPQTLKPTISGRPPSSAIRSSSYVIDDLDAQASSMSTLRVPLRTEAAVLSCPMVRLSIRCPAPLNRRGTWGDGAHLRSGIVTLDLHGLYARIGRVNSVPMRPRGVTPRGSEGTSSTVEWKEMLLFFCRVSAKKSTAFLAVGPLAPEPGEVDPVVLLPTVEIKSTNDPTTSVKTQLVTCRTPSVQSKIHQPTIEGLQFFADDITHWLDGAFGDGSRPKPRDELKMIGSRFFGSKASSSASSSAIEDEEDESGSATVMRVVVSEADISLHVPRATAKEEGERVLSLRASDIDARIESNTTGRQDTAFILAVMDADFSDQSDPSSPRCILSRTTPLTLTAHNHPIVQLRFTSFTDPITETKETGIKLTCASFTCFVTAQIAWIQDLARFAETPEGVFEDVIPSEITRVNLQVYDGSIHLKAPNMMGAVVVVLGEMAVKMDIVSDAEVGMVEMGLSASHLLAIDEVGMAGDLIPGQPSVEAWKRAGYAPLVKVMVVDAQLWRVLLGPSVMQLDVLDCQVRVTACADSLATVGLLAGDLATIVPKDNVANPVKSPVTLDQPINVFASVDEDAFNRVPDMISGADLIEDDLPTNLDYLDHAARHADIIPTDGSTGETLRSWQSTGEDDASDVRLTSEVNGETIKILHPEPFEMDDDYWDTLPVSRGFADDAKVGKMRVRVHDCCLTLFFYDGYDWQRTRKAIEDEMKSVRKRLERIRQLLASGQKADESIENARSVLFNSVYIGLDQSRDNLDSAALLAAIDEELDDLGQETASQSSWQTDFPSGHRISQRHTAMSASGKKARLRGKRLTRSNRPQIEMALGGIKIDVDVYDPEEPIASRLHVTVRSMEILDHIKTSTWKKFLTEMKADSKGNVRETDADMVRVELVAVRPLLPSLEEESRLRAKFLPLRLHVDQDALDFLKRFSSFSAPASTTHPTDPPPPSSPATSKKASPETPFFQHVEIFPIELKLDYKPKRVDFGALREGKTIELMNLFHFDGAEMTLRHVTVSGISGWARLSTLLQDIWTPDVRANQLADVISGVSAVRSMVNVGSGVADLILLPIEQYRKDGRVARGVQRGTSSFVKSTALEMMKLGARLATGTQVILEKAEAVLGGRLGDEAVVVEVPRVGEGGGVGEGSWSSEDEGGGGAEVVSRYADQPEGAREGVQAAYASLSKNVHAAAQTILAVPMEVYERSGDDGPLRAVVRAVPIAVLKPMIGASEAVSKTLLGMRNQLDPDARRELGDKYKQRAG